jgi:ABC-type glycerol-3-phosphate transport system substrate-binding protein
MNGRVAGAQWTRPGRATARRPLLFSAIGGAGGALVPACAPGGAPSGPQPATCRSKLEFYTPFAATTVQYQGFQDAITAFGRQRSGCTVEQVPQAGAPAVQEKLTATLAGGTPPALTVMPPGNVTIWSAAGIIAPVDDLFKRDRLNSADFPAPLWTPMSHGGKVWFLPLFANADFVLHWNQAHFREAGLDPGKGPQTIADLDRMIQQLTREHGGDLARLGMQPWDTYGLGNTIQAWGYAFGGSFYDERRDELTFTHPRVMRAVEWYTGWAQRLGVDRVNQLRRAAATPAGAHFFATGLVSIAPMTSPNLRATQRHDAQLQIGAGPMPAEAPGTPGTVTVGGQCIAAVPGSTRAEAWDFMRFIGASEEGTTLVARTAGTPGWLKSPGLNELAADPLQKAYIDGLRRAQSVQLGYYAPFALNLAPIQEVVDGKRAVRDALEAINREANQSLKDLRAQLGK